MEHYVYRALRTTPNSTRLLQILPDVQGTDIHCVVFDYTLPQDRASGPYEALSYVWGDQTKTRQIFIRDASPTDPPLETLAYLNITTNLYAALQRLRDPFIPRLIWIDAVCINQEWVEERAAQVLFMAKIYLHASRVIVWLGEEADDSSRALAALEQASMKIRRDDRSNHGHSVFDSEYPPISLHEQAHYSEELVQRSIETLLKRPWFHRVWILQEVAAARQLSIICGIAEITGMSFVEGLTDVTRESDLPIDSTELSVLDMMAWEPPSQSQHLSSTTEPLQLNILPLGDLFEKFYSHGATDKRDKVFGLLGLCHPTRASIALPRPDYTKAWSSVVTDLLQYSLGPSITTTTGDNDDQVIITGQGWPIGKVTDISADRITIICSHFSGPQDGDGDCETNINREGRRREIQLNDILWQMDGAPFPCIIRHHHDHFLIVTLSVPASLFILRWQLKRLILTGPDMWESRSIRSRRITLVWTIGSIPYQKRSFRLSRASVEIDDRTHPGCDRRWLECARILDDVSNENGLRAVIDSDREMGDQRHFSLLRLALSNWASYQWLKKFCETLRWIVHRLLAWQEGHVTTYKHLREYWKSEGYLAFDILEIDDLLKRQWKQSEPPTAHKLWNVLEETTNRWDFGAKKHSNFLSLFFRQHSQRWHGLSKGAHEQWSGNARFLIHLMLPDPKLPTGPVYAPNNVLESMISDGYRIENSVNLHLIAFGFVSEAQQNVFRLPKKTLRSLVNCPKGADILSFLLAESYRDVQLIYSILQVAIERECEAYVIESARRSDRSYKRRVEHQRRSESDRYKSPDTFLSRHILMAPWLHENVCVLEAYIQHSDICKVAHLNKDDVVLPTLLAVFSYFDETDFGHDRPSSETIRWLILKGIAQFLEVHHAIVTAMSHRTKRTVRTLAYVRGEWPGDDFEGKCHVDPSDLWLPQRGICMMRALWKEYKEASEDLGVKEKVFWVDEHGFVTFSEKGKVRERLEEAFEAYDWGTTPTRDETPANKSWPPRPMSPDEDIGCESPRSMSWSSEQDMIDCDGGLETSESPLADDIHAVFYAGKDEYSSYDASDSESSDLSHSTQENPTSVAEASDVTAEELQLVHE